MATVADAAGNETDGLGANFHALLSQLHGQYVADVAMLRAEIARLRQEGTPNEEVEKLAPLSEATCQLLRVDAGNNTNRMDAERNALCVEKEHGSHPCKPFDEIVFTQPREPPPKRIDTDQPSSRLGSGMFRSTSGEQDLAVRSTTSNSVFGAMSQDTFQVQCTKLSVENAGGFCLHADWTAERHTQLGEVDEHHVEQDTKSLLKRVGTTLTTRSKRVVSREFDRKRSKFVIDPGSDRRMAWDVAGMVLIAWDLVTVPFLVFDPEENIITTFMEWVTLLFWTTDMGWSVFTGFFKDGRLVTSHKAILLRYIKTWFAIDLLVVVPDWVMTLMGSSSNVGKLGRLLKAARVIRVLRLLRLLKLRRLVNELYDRIASELMFIVVELVKLLTFILVLNHLVACCWYGVGFIGYSIHAEKNWLQDIGMTPVMGEDLAWRYFTSLHWSITQFTPASMDISATNTGERIFSIFILFFALVALSSVISSVSTAMTVIRNMSGDRQKQFWMLRRYLTQRKVSKELAGRIVKYVEHRLQSKSNVLLPTRVIFLTHLSDHLANQLSYETNSPTLQCHVFFRFTMVEHPTVMYRICSVALKQVSYALDDEVFADGELSVAMYFVKTGTFAYRKSFMLEKKAYFAEATLWTSWYHRGNLCCADEIGELVGVISTEFGAVLRSNPRTWDFAVDYASMLIAYMNNLESSQLTDVSHMAIDTEFAYKYSGGTKSGEIKSGSSSLRFAWG